jgi:hypothetical protein
MPRDSLVQAMFKFVESCACVPFVTLFGDERGQGRQPYDGAYGRRQGEEVVWRGHGGMMSLLSVYCWSL